MNYEKIYNNLIQKRLINKIDHSICYCEYHHIKPKSIYPALSSDKSNIVALTAKEHYIAHHLLMHWYKQKYGEKHAYYHKMLTAFLFTINIQNKQDKSQYVTARTYEYLKIQLSKARRGKPSWNSGKHGIYSDEYRKKISDNHADFNGENNGRYGSRAMINLKTNDVKIVPKDQIDSFIKHGYVIKKHLKKFNNGKIEVMALTCPDGFIDGKLPPVHTEEKLRQIKINRHNGMIRRTQRLRVEGRLGNKSSTFTTKGRKWMYNPATKHRIYIKCDDVQKYLDRGYKFGSK